MSTVRPNDPYLLGLSLTLNVALTAVVLRATTGPRPSTPRTLTIGTAMPPITGRDLAGNAVTLAVTGTGKPTLLYAFTTACPWCKRNVPNINAIAAAKRSEYQVVGLALESDPSLVTAYISKYSLALDTVVLPGETTTAAYRLGGVPTTILLSTQARVGALWTGAYSGDIGDEIAKKLAVTLPGMAPPQVRPQPTGKANERQ